MVYKRIVSLLFTLSLVGCSSIGPKEVSLDRASYDEIVRQTDSQQVLTNIVRLRYVEPTSFLQITNVTASYSLSDSLSLTPSWSGSVTSTAGLPNSKTITQSLGVSPGVTFTDSPTISYAPINSSAAVTILQTPISFSEMYILLSGGIDDVPLFGRLLFNRVNTLDNAASATNPYVINKIEYEPYYKFLKLLDELLYNKKAQLIPATYNGNPVFNLVFAPGVDRSPSAMTIKKLLDINLASKNIIFSPQIPIPVAFTKSGQLANTSPSSKDSNIALVQTRSIFSIMTYLAHAVQIPDDDIKKNVVQKNVDARGQPFNWTPLIKDLMTIYSSDSEPNDAFVKTYLHGHWFYIKDSDIASKATFSLLMRLIVITGGIQPTAQQQGPTLTIPVGA